MAARKGREGTVETKRKFFIEMQETLNIENPF